MMFFGKGIDICLHMTTMSTYLVVWSLLSARVNAGKGYVPR